MSLAPLFLLASGFAAAQGAAPDPEDLLDKALNVPAISFEGRMMVTYWYGKQTRAEEVQVYHSPPNRNRREFFDPDGSLARFVVSDGEREEVHLLREKKILAGDAAKSTEKLMSPEEERKLLLRNYGLSVARQDKVAGRACWVLELKPRVKGKPHHKLWIDQETGVVLENKRFSPKRHFAAQSRFSRFEPKKELDQSLFRLELGTGAVAGHGLEPDFMTLEELKQAIKEPVDFPRELPAGFVFESADYFEVGTQVVRHARYTDGLSVLSLFETDRPVRLPKGGTMTVAPAGRKGAGSLRLSSSGKVLSFRRGRQYFTLMGDLSRELLESVAARLK